MNLMLASSAGELTHVKQDTGWLIRATKSPRARLPPGPSTKRTSPPDEHRLRVQYYIMPASIMKKVGQSPPAKLPSSGGGKQ